MGRIRAVARRAHWMAAAASLPLLLTVPANAGTVPANAGTVPATSATPAATYYASPSATASSPCSQASPCRLDHAVAAAHAGDVVVVLPGTYSVTYEVSTGQAITIEGQPGQPMPSLIGAASLGRDTVTVSGGATVSNLDIETASQPQGHNLAALSITGGVGENLVLGAGPGDTEGEALQVNDSSTGTVVRTVLATSEAKGGSVVSFGDGPQSGNASVYNLTAIGTGDNKSTISGDLDHGTVLVKDSILMGSPTTFAADDSSDQPMQVQSSDIQSPGEHDYVDGGGNITASPVFVDAAGGNFREAASSPTIDAGSPDPNLSATDLDGSPRVLGSAPDMGAYEFVPVVSPSPPPTPATPPAPPAGVPVYGTSVVLQPVSGTVLVALPHSKDFQPLSGGSVVPVGSTIDATGGTVALTSAINRSGAAKTGNFHGARFTVGQRTKGSGRTQLRLLGGSFAACHASRLTHTVMARAAGHPKHHPHKVVRQLWGSDNGGQFTTVGRTASAAVRGTVWLTQDRCDGTFVKVLKGHVVVRDRHGHVITLGPGQSYLARSRP